MTDPRPSVNHPGTTILLEGTNFSGRTDLLRRCIAESGRAGRRAVYVGPDVHQSVSSLVPTVLDELLLHFANSPHQERLLQSARALGLDRCFHQSPFTLSGGQQVMLVVLCKLGLDTRLLALDGTVDELDSENARGVIELLSSEPTAETATLLTANGYAQDRAWRPSARLWASEMPRLGNGAPAPRFDASDFLCAPPATTGCLEADHLSFAYDGAAPVLNEVSFRLEPGQIYSLEGRNGAGKTTLARILTGVLRVRHGRLAFGGRRWDAWKAPGRVAVMQMQNPDTQLFANSVAAELSALPVPVRRAATALAGVDHLLPENPFDLPFVLRKRLTFSAVVHLSRPWFIFDEPTLGQDAAACDELVTVLRQVAAAGAGVVVVSHSREFVRRLPVQRLRLQDGRLIELGVSAA
jgi:energy-coupling factor transport system ATP-binding protein